MISIIRTSSILTATIILSGLSIGSLSNVLAAPDSASFGPGTPPGILALVTNDDLFATADLTTLAPMVGPGPRATQHYGAYESGSPDSGTCGNDWAEDTFDRHFTVFKNPDGTLTVVQQFKAGSFVTNAGPSPGSCQPGNTPGIVDADKTGNVHGYFIIPLQQGTTQTSTDPHCNAFTMTDSPCTTAIFLESHFTCTYQVTCSVTTFSFHYSAGDQGLIGHEWKNASPDRGGNNGDIRSS
jgi:hypothetical protein